MKNIKNIVAAITLLVGLVITAQEKQNVSVLYVGYNPEVPMPEITKGRVPGSMRLERFQEDYKTRFPAFMDYLNNNFTKVKGVDARAYKADMSKNYDVTIFDQTPPVISDRILEYDDNGQVTKYVPAKYIEEDFDHATIFIAETAPKMGEPIGLKLDWLCLCLDADAHHVNTEHPIFKGPLKVSLTFEEKPTPAPLLKYSYKDYPEKLPMWRVQKEGYVEGKGYRVGMVSRGYGFLDSPDSEIISNGVHTKASDAVAIGRHGNFLLWGFSASPDYMTDEAKIVFANAITYMKQFKGKKPIARKYDSRVRTREATIDGAIHGLTEKAYKAYVTMIEDTNKSSAKYIKELDAKKAKGEKLTEMEKAISKAQRKPRPPATWEAYTKMYMMGYDKEFGTDIDGFIGFLNDNREYVGYNKENLYNSFIIDEDVKSLGVSNRKLEFLETCISNLKESSKSELASKLLKRYTNEDFNTHKEWLKWFKTNKQNLFFTESGGYKWLVNTY